MDVCGAFNHFQVGLDRCGRLMDGVCRSILLGDTADAIRWIHGGGDVDTIEDTPLDGASLLMVAAQCGQDDLCRILLQRSADVNLADAQGHTALMCAAFFDNASTVALLLRAGADPLAASTPEESTGTASWTALSLAESRHCEACSCTCT